MRLRFSNRPGSEGQSTGRSFADEASSFVPWYRRAGVWIGIGTSPGAFTVGGALSAHLPLMSLLVVVPVSAGVLAALAVVQGVISRRRREASAQRAVTAFGRSFGAVLLNVVIALGTLGWLGFYAGMAGFATANLLGLPSWLGTLALTLFLLVVYVVGLNRWNSLVWLTAISTVCVALFALHSAGTRLAPDHVSTLHVGAFLWGAGNIVAYGLLFALRVGDFSWDLRTDGDVVKSGSALFVPVTAFMLIGAIVYRATGSYDIADVLARNQSAALGNLFLVISVIAPSMSGFHSANLVIASSSSFGKRVGPVLIWLLCFGLGLLRFDHELLLFLSVLMAFVAPAITVMLLIAVLKGGFSRAAAMVSWLIGSVMALAAKFLTQLSPMIVGAGVGIIAFLIWIILSRVARNDGSKVGIRDSHDRGGPA